MERPKMPHHEAQVLLAAAIFENLECPGPTYERLTPLHHTDSRELETSKQQKVERQPVEHLGYLLLTG
jgi:hypothetical protein